MPFLNEDVQVLQSVERQVPGTVSYTITRYYKKPQWQVEDTGALVYAYTEGETDDNYLELRFCLSGNFYCKDQELECNNCRMNKSWNCESKIETIDVLRFRFSPAYLQQFSKGTSESGNLSDKMLSFRHNASMTRVLPLCNKTRAAIETLLNHNYTDTLENIFINAQTQILLIYSMDCMVGEKLEQGFVCKFLENEADREKIVLAREILLQHIGNPLTIKALSRKVAMNECYLKKGFKEIFGTTIFDFYQGQRMEHAKYLLNDKGLSVTEVSMLLGYSSISHFSTAFKKHTGLKPCELLLN